MKNVFYLLLATAVALTFVNCKNNMKIKSLPYPVAYYDSTVTDNYHGTEVADPYRWLEDDNSQQTAQWVADENAVTQNYLAQIPYRDAIKERLTKLWDYPKDGMPRKVGDYYFSFRNNGLQNQSVLYYQKGLEGAQEVFLDPNTLSGDGTVALNAIAFSDDNKYMAYSVSASGSDWVEIKVMDIASRAQMSDLIKWVKFSTASWAADSKGFYYSRYDEPKKGGELSAQNQHQKVYYHTLGTEQSADKLVYEDNAHPLRYFNAEESSDGRYLFIFGSEGTHGTEVLYKNLAKKERNFTVLFKGFEYDYSIVECEGDKAYVYTNESAPNYRLASIDLTKPAGLSDVIAQNEQHLLSGVGSVGGQFMAVYMENAMNSVYQYDKAGVLVRKVDLPGIGTVSGFDGKKESVQTFYSLTTFTSPTSIYTYDMGTGSSTLLRAPQVNFNPELYATEQVFFPSKDSTMVSMFIVHRTDMKLDGKNPLYLYGYGGFNISLTPSFSPSNIMFMEQGGIYVMVNLRGGGEYGEKWHKGGMLDNKQNVFDDFIAAAEYLVANKYTSPQKLAIAGGSNGGLLVGACMVQRPDLFAVALPAVGVMDMLRYHKFTIGWGWAVEYGSSESAEQFEYIYKYSPLHNIKKGVCYPATLITTADHDDRVVPAHSFKFAATLQAAQGCDRPTLIRIDSKAGHGAGKPTTKRIEEAADVFSFVFYNTDSNVNLLNK